MVSKDLRRRIRRAWSQETSNDPASWTPQNPAWGQCAVTALIVQDYCGGNLLRCDAHLPGGRTIGHYFNMRADGSLLDLTKRQFPKGTKFSPALLRTRKHVLAYPDTKLRYEKLREALGALPEKQRP